MPKKPKSFVRFGVEVSSFLYCGAIGAEHYYGEAWWSSNDHRTEKEKLTHPMSDKIARYLNKKDEVRFNRYKKGDLTERFDSKQDVIDAAIKFLTAKFGTHIVIESGSSVYHEDDNDVVYPKE